MQDAIILYENGKAIGGEGHPTYARDTTFENTGTDLESEQVNDAIIEVYEKTMGRTTLLCTIPSNATDDSVYNLSDNISHYKFLFLVGSDSFDTCAIMPVSIFANKGIGITEYYAPSGVTPQFRRFVLTKVSDTSVKVYRAYNLGSTSSYLYGIK